MMIRPGVDRRACHTRPRSLRDGVRTRGKGASSPGPGPLLEDVEVELAVLDGGVQHDGVLDSLMPGSVRIDVISPDDPKGGQTDDDEGPPGGAPGGRRMGGGM